MTDDQLRRCRWPRLASNHDRALRAAVAYVLSETLPLGIIATGTIIRGQAHPASDLDIYVLHDAPYRRRIQRFFEGVPTEIFINPPQAVRSYFPDEHTAGRRFTAHMLATGFVVLDADPVVEQLRSESREWLARPEALSDAAAERARYAAATLLEDGADLSATDAVGAALILARAVTQMLELWLRAQRSPLPRAKEMYAEVAARDPLLGQLVERFVGATSARERLDAAHDIADRTIHTRGFFEWDSGPEPVPGADASADGRGNA
jgi:hypothetical protein